MVIGNGSSIQPKDLPHEIIDTIDSVRSKKKMFALREGQKSLWDVEKGIIERALTESKWNQVQNSPGALYHTESSPVQDQKIWDQKTRIEFCQFRG